MSAYTYNPYNSCAAVRPVATKDHDAETSTMCELAAANLPAGTLRLNLYGKVAFVPFPENVLSRHSLRGPAPPAGERPENLRQLFFGQLPFKVTDAMILWLCSLFANNAQVLYIERVLQEKSRTGCMQVFVDEYDAPYIITALNKRVLFDATGVWVAQDDMQIAALQAHCADSANRFKGQPFRLLVVERSTSTFIRRGSDSPRPSAAATRSPSPDAFPYFHRQQQQNADAVSDECGSNAPSDEYAYGAPAPYATCAQGWPVFAPHEAAPYPTTDEEFYSNRFCGTY